MKEKITVPNLNATSVVNNQHVVARLEKLFDVSASMDRISNELVLEGVQKHVDKAKSALATFDVNEKHYESVNIEAIQARYLMGQKGEHVNRIEAQTGVLLNILKDESGNFSGEIEVCGTKSQVDSAKLEIDRLLTDMVKQTLLVHFSLTL